MKKQLFDNQPSVGKNSIYTFLDDDDFDAGSLHNSNGLPERYDKFEDKALFTTSTSDSINDLIVNNELSRVSNASIKVDEINIKNNGVPNKINHVRFRAWIFDSNVWNTAYGTSEPDTSKAVYNAF